MSDEDAVYELSIDQPNLPKGEPVQIPGLGTFKNGSSHPVTKEEAQAFRVYHTRQENIIDEQTDEVLGSQPVLGPTLLQASKNMFGVEVTTVEKSDSGDTKRSSSSSSAVTAADKDTSKTTPNAEAVKVQDTKPAPDPNRESTKTEGGANQ